MTDSEDSHGDPHYHGDSDPERCPMNPEPPKELLDNQLIDADNIGGTVFSKHFVFTTLMKLIQVKKQNKQTNNNNNKKKKRSN